MTGPNSEAKEKNTADPTLAPALTPTQTQPATENSAPDAEATEVVKPPRAGIVSRVSRTVRIIIFGSWANVLLVFVPAGIAVHFAHAPAGVVFAMNAIAIVPLAGLLGKATETVAAGFGDAIGALMNVTFGNAVELIIL